MFTVGVTSFISTILTIREASQGEPYFFSLQISLWLWFTVLFGNFAEAIAEGRGKAQAESLRKTKTETLAKKLDNINDEKFKLVPATALWARGAGAGRSW